MSKQDGIAIIGLAGRFPGAKTVAEFWRNLTAGDKSISFFDDEELRDAGIAKETLDDPNYVKAKGMLDDVEWFDAAFFGITPKEAEIMDPQQRLFLECVWTALEDAGYDSEQFAGPIGLFAGASINSYLMLNLFSNRGLIDLAGILQSSIPNRTDHLTTRCAYKLNLKGPALTVQTACSTSLVAVHLACQSLLNYQCDMALAGGVTVSVPQKSGYYFQEGGVLSPDGYCRPFDHKANGTVTGNGVGVVVLKRLSEALADGDEIHAVIKGSAINNDGSLKVGYTAPSVEGQVEVIAMAQAVAGVTPDTISYIEAHGTGTTLGDPIEIAALKEVFAAGTDRKNFCAIGSVKANIGHLDVAAGVAGLIKTTLALKHRVVPPLLHFESANPQIDLRNGPFHVNAQPVEWKNGEPRRAGVSSFGIGGTNAHVVLEEAPQQADTGPSRPSQLLMISARSAAALETATTNLSTWLKENPNANFADVAYTLAVGRRPFKHRRLVVARDADDAAQALDALDPRRVVTGLQEPKDRPVMFMFPGQGAQYPNMGRQLYELEPVFRATVDQCAEQLKPLLGLDLRDVLYPQSERVQQSEERLRQTAITQPALFVTEYALATLLGEWSVRPAGMIGHSLGEFVAACLAGVLSLNDALTLVAARGRLMQSAEGGAMLSVPLPEQEIQPLLGSNLSLASVNAPSLGVVSGPTAAIDELENELKAKDVLCRRLHTSHAFHSQMMESILDEFRSEVEKLSFKQPPIPFVSNLTGGWIKPEEATDPEYWVRHLRQTVRFGDGVTRLFEEPEAVLLEVGPGTTLMTIARWHPAKAAGQMVLTSLPQADDAASALNALQNGLGRLWLAGVKISWSNYFTGEQRRRVSLPTYPFERRRYWIEPGQQTPGALTGQSPRKKENLTDWFYIPSWKSSALPAPFATLDVSGSKSCVLLADECGLAERLAAKLEQAGCEVTMVHTGERFAARGERDFIVAPQQREDFEQLVQALNDRGQWPARIVHLWNVLPQFDSLLNNELAAECQEKGFYSLLALAQALGNRSDSVELTVVTNEMQAVTGDESLSPEKATVLGPCRVVPQEYKQVKCRSIDVKVPDNDVARDRLAELLAVELLSGLQEKTVAYRHQQRWVQNFEPHALTKTDKQNARLREKGVYLITGGMGGMGLVFAEQLARVAGARLALVGRSPFPARDRWRRWLGTHSEHDEVSQKIRCLQELEKYGARVEVFSADVADLEQMQTVLARVGESLGPVNGVIHAAGIPGGGMIPLKTADKAAAILAPKVTGTRVLGRLLQDTKLDFLVLCSSRSSILGGFGQIDYCAANAFLDAFSHYYAAKTGTFTVAVDWDGWQEVGMLVNTAAQYGVNARAAAAKQKLDHPLLAEVTQTAERTTFLTQFSVAESWILEEHRIGGRAVLPGVTYLEMARAAFEQHEGNGVPVELRDVFFVTPMSLADDEKRDLRLVFERAGETFKFRASSKPSSARTNEATWQDHAIGEIGRAPEREQRRHDLDAIIRRCNKQELLPEDSERDPDLGPRWQNIRKVYLGEREMVVLFELDEDFTPDLQWLKLHPSLLDRAAGTGMLYMELEGIYLPMSYKRLRVEQALPRRIFAHIRETANNYSRKETITFDVLIMDEHGHELVEIEEFAEKRINDLTEQVRSTSDKRTALALEEDVDNNAVTTGSFYEASLREGMAPAEGVEVFTRILARATAPQIIVSTKDLAASIAEAEAFIENKVSKEIEKLQVARTLHPRPEVQTAYVAPRNELEELLAGIMQEALGLDRVGIDDNFFELGGDSVLSIQIIARVNRAGWQITPQQIFQHQTIAELSAVAVRTSGAEARTASASVETPPAPAFSLTGLEGRKLNKLSRLLEEDEDNEDDPEAEEVVAVLAAETTTNGGNGTYVAPPEPPPGPSLDQRPMDFSLFYFAADNSQSGADKYRLYLEGAKFADRNGFTAVWTPERHFHESGGLYPNPSVLSAALATITEQIKLRAGSVVLPLHHSIRVAEEWSMVDNLSGGRVGLSFTSGWIPNDFAFFPERFPNKREEMLRGIEEVQRLWRGETIAVIDGAGKNRELKILPRPLQKELPIWLTCSGDPQMFVKAGELGLNVLTALLSQSVEEVAGKIKLYREARAAHGYDPGCVSLMVHTFVGESEKQVLDLTRGPLTDYLKAHVGLIETMTQSLDIKIDIDKEQYLDYLVAFAFERYYQSASLIGTPGKCLPLVNRLSEIGVDELACFIDFGVEVNAVLEGLHHLNELRKLCAKTVDYPPLAQAAQAAQVR